MINPYTLYYGSPTTLTWVDEPKVLNIGRKQIDLDSTSKVKTEDRTSKIENDIAWYQVTTLNSCSRHIPINIGGNL